MQNFKKIWNLISAPLKSQAILLLILMLFGAFFESIGLGMVLPLIGLMTAPEAIMNHAAVEPLLRTLGYPDHKTVFFILLASFVSIYLFILIYRLWLSWRQNAFLYSLRTDLSHKLYSSYMHQSWNFHLERHSSKLIQNIINETNLLMQYGFSGFLNFVRESTLLFAAALFLLFVEPLGTLIVLLIFSPLGWLFQRLSRMRIQRWADARLQEEGLILKCVQEGLGSVKELKILGRENLFLSKFRMHAENLARIGRLQGFMRQLTRPVFEFFAIAGLCIAILSMSMSGKELTAMAPVLGLLAAAVLRLMPSMNQALVALHGVRFVSASVDTIHKELENLKGTKKVRNISLLPFASKLELVEVSYSYSGSVTPTLTRVSLTIPKGSLTAIIGSTGAGKSTIMDIILGLLTPTNGTVLVDETDIRNHAREWQNQIAYVSQSIVLVDESLRRNIALGVPDDEIDDIAVWRAVDSAQIGEFVRSLPEQLDTLVGERGARLSGGERQRTGIARALYFDSPVLVLDEATSSLDEKSEALIMDTIRRLKGKKTIIMITHRLATTRGCDQVVRIDGGQVVETYVPEPV